MSVFHRLLLTLLLSVALLWAAGSRAAGNAPAAEAGAIRHMDENRTRTLPNRCAESGIQGYSPEHGPVEPLLADFAASREDGPTRL